MESNDSSVGGGAQIEAERAVCEDCNTTVRAGYVDGDFGLFCNCTLEDGKPFKPVRNTLPWPQRWSDG